jgi:hypothetical protein
MRYLLDELTAYEEGFSNILMSDSTSDRHEVFMGGNNASSTVLHADLHGFGTALLQKVQDLFEGSTQAIGGSGQGTS